MRWQVVRIPTTAVGRICYEEIVRRDLTATQASELRRLIAALQTDGDADRFVVRQQTGF